LIAEILKLFVGTPSEYRALSGAMVGKSELELEQIALELQRRSAQRAHTRLTLMRGGLADTETNFAKIDAKLGPHYTIQEFRDAIAQYPAFKQSLQWDAEPFAALVQEEQKQAAEEQKHFALFVICANAATKNGKNVAPSKANFKLIKEAIEDKAKDFSSAKIIDAIWNYGLDLRPNNQTVTDELLDQERDRLAQVVVDAMRSWKLQGRGGSTMPDTYGRNQMLEKVKHLSLTELRSRVEVIEPNRALAAKSQGELKAQIAQDRQQQYQARVAASRKPSLPEFNTVTNERMDKAYLLRLANINPSKYRELVLRHGSQAITLRLNGQG
jgi:hypothetical protein